MQNFPKGTSCASQIKRKKFGRIARIFKIFLHLIRLLRIHLPLKVKAIEGADPYGCAEQINFMGSGEWQNAKRTTNGRPYGEAILSLITSHFQCRPYGKAILSPITYHLSGRRRRRPLPITSHLQSPQVHQAPIPCPSIF